MAHCPRPRLMPSQLPGRLGLAIVTVSLLQHSARCQEEELPELQHFPSQEVWQKPQHLNIPESGRYSRFEKVPDDKDRKETHEMALDIYCDVCQVISASLTKAAKSNSEDDIADMLEWSEEPSEEKILEMEAAIVGKQGAEGPEGKKPEEAAAIKKQIRRAFKGMKGCAWHYKEELLFKGYQCNPCEDQTDPSRIHYCLIEKPYRIGVWDALKHDTEKDALFMACEATIGKYGDDLAKLIAELLQVYVDRKQAVNHTKVAHRACRAAGRCKHRGVKKKGKKEEL